MELTLPVTLQGYSPPTKNLTDSSSGTSLGAPVANTAAQMIAELRSHLEQDTAQQYMGGKPLKVPGLQLNSTGRYITHAGSNAQKFVGPDEASPLILVVEDNVAMNSFLKETLGREYRVVTAVNGQVSNDIFDTCHSVKLCFFCSQISYC